MTVQSEAALDVLADALLPRLIARGVLLSGTPKLGAPHSQTPAPSRPYAANYDAVSCQVFLKREHLGDRVLERAATFFGLLDKHGEISSPDLVAALGLRGARSVPANLTNSLKKRARRMRIPVPWSETTTPDGLRTVWRDRDGIAVRMVEAIEDERRHRGL